MACCQQMMASCSEMIGTMPANDDVSADVVVNNELLWMNCGINNI